jgi:hypothetical protein
MAGLSFLPHAATDKISRFNAAKRTIPFIYGIGRVVGGILTTKGPS